VTTTDINQTDAIRNDVVSDWEGIEAGAELPSQGGGMTTLMPGTNVFLVPKSLPQLWSEEPIKDSRQFLANGQPNPTFEKQVIRKVLKFTKEAPLIVVGGPLDGQPLAAKFTSNPRPRGGKKDNPKTAWVSDLAYLLGVGFADPARPTTLDELIAAINKYAGGQIKLAHGLQGRCDPERVRYIATIIPADPIAGTPESEIIAQDPAGQKGCGHRYYTKDFKDPQSPGGYSNEVQCGGKIKVQTPAGVAEVPCGAIIRGFSQWDTILPPA
jgi:hypothetical protein